MWRMTKAIIISWLVGVICGVGLVIVMQGVNRTSPLASTEHQPFPQSTGAAPATSDTTTR